MQVFRNQTSYNRFWDGRNYLTVIITCVRNLTRSFLANSHRSPVADRIETERIIRVLIAILYATKNHLRADWGAEIIPGTAVNPSTGNATATAEYSDLLPKGLYGCDDRGLGLVLQLTFFVEQYIKKGFDKGAFHAPQASQMQVQLNSLVDAYGRMETIRLTPIPIAHLYGCPTSCIPWRALRRWEIFMADVHGSTGFTRNKCSPSSAASYPLPWSIKWTIGPYQL